MLKCCTCGQLIEKNSDCVSLKLGNGVILRHRKCYVKTVMFESFVSLCITVFVITALVLMMWCD